MKKNIYKNCSLYSPKTTLLAIFANFSHLWMLVYTAMKRLKVNRERGVHCKGVFVPTLIVPFALFKCL